MKITPNQTFRHDREQYEPDAEYDVSDELGHYFVNVGWASSADAPAAEGQDESPTLDVSDVANEQSPKDV